MLSSVLNRNLYPIWSQRQHMDAVPLLTMVKQRTIDEGHAIEASDASLDATLSMLCSFLTVDDVVSFLFSEPFTSYARTQDPWLVFELGLYADHTKTLELVASSAHLLFADPHMTGAWTDAVLECKEPAEVVNALSAWLTHVA